MKAPAFFEAETPTLLARLLAPLGALYGAATARRMARPGVPAPCPVVCIGNFTAGGAGKTPTAIAVARVLASQGRRPVFLSRGHGGRERGPLLVDPQAHGAADVGDEPLLLARHAAVVVARDRLSGAALAARHGDVIVMDDGLQNPSLAKDFSLAAIDGATGFGNGLCLPAGPLRAPPAAQWPHVDAAIVIGEGEAGARAAREAALLGKPILRAMLRPDPEAATRLRGQRVLAFAGIGRPQKFFETLRGIGAEVVEERAFVDHHPFSVPELEALAAEARRKALLLVTTEKDAVRLRAVAERLRIPATALPVRLVTGDDALLRELLDAALQVPSDRESRV